MKLLLLIIDYNLIITSKYFIKNLKRTISEEYSTVLYKITIKIIDLFPK